MSNVVYLCMTIMGLLYCGNMSPAVGQTYGQVQWGQQQATSTPNVVIFDGVANVVTGQLNTTTHTWTPALSGNISPSGNWTFTGTVAMNSSLTVAGPLQLSSITGPSFLAASSNGTVLLANGAPYPVYASAYGVTCDGATDNAAALQAWLNALSQYSVGVLPTGSGVCKFGTPLSLASPPFHVTIQGNGAHLVYTGATTTVNMITLGTTRVSAGCSFLDWRLENFYIASNTNMTAGDALRMNDGCYVTMRSVTFDGNFDGNGNLWNGLHANGGNTFALSRITGRGKNDALVVNGDHGVQQFTEMWIEQSHFLLSNNGIHIAGFVGGIFIDSTDILQNVTNNLLIDRANSADANLQVSLGVEFVSDLGAVNGLHVSDAGSVGSVIRITGSWFASTTTGMLFDAGVQWVVNQTGGYVAFNLGDGIKNNSANLQMFMTGVFDSNNIGWGFNNVGGVAALVRMAGVTQMSNAAGQSTGLNPSPAGCGAAASVTGNDNAGLLFTGSTAATTTCGLTFKHAYDHQPICVFTPVGTTTPGAWWVSSAGVAAYTMSWATGTTNEFFNYICREES